MKTYHHTVIAGDDEEWRASWPGYEVSSYGRIRSVDRVVSSGQGRQRIERGRHMRLYRREDGRVQVNLRVGRVRSPFVHTLVAAAFIGARPNGLEVCHNDGNASNNQPSNLRYDTHAANVADTRRHGRDPSGERNGQHKLTMAQVLTVLSDSRPQRVIAEELGCSQQAVSDIKRGRRWARAMTAASEAARK